MGLCWPDSVVVRAAARSCGAELPAAIAMQHCPETATGGRASGHNDD